MTHTHCRKCKLALPPSSAYAHLDGVCSYGCYTQLETWLRADPVRHERLRRTLNEARERKCSTFTLPAWAILVDEWEMNGCP